MFEWIEYFLEHVQPTDRENVEIEFYRRKISMKLVVDSFHIIPLV